MSKFDLSKMEKMHQDRDSATFHHKDGHVIKIAVKALSPKMQKELDRLPMAKGGEAGVNRSMNDQTPGTSRMGDHIRQGNHAAAKDTAQKTLREMDRSPKPKLKGFLLGGDTTQDGVEMSPGAGGGGQDQGALQQPAEQSGGAPAQEPAEQSQNQAQATQGAAPVDQFAAKKQEELEKLHKENAAFQQDCMKRLKN